MRELSEEEKKFLKLFRLLAPDLSTVDDETVIIMLELCGPMISKERFGDLYDQALVYLVAHRLLYTNLIANGGAGSAKLISGHIVSEKEGDLARSFGSVSGNGNGATSYIDNLDKTSYGLEFKRIRDMCILPIVTRFG